MGSKQYDVVVVGSGAAGGMAVRKLTEAGLDVLLLEAGRDPTQPGGDDPKGVPAPPKPKRTPQGLGDQIKSTVGEQVERAKTVADVLGRTGFELGTVLSGRPDLQRMIHLRAEDESRHGSDRQMIQSECPAFGKDSADLYVDDVDNPYMVPSSLPYHWIRGRQLGGRTQIWKRMTPRLSQDELKAPERDGDGEAWPLNYSDLEPYYEYCERVLRVTGPVEAGAKGYSGALAARAMTKAENGVASAVSALHKDCKVTLSPYASPFGPGETGDIDERVDRYDHGGHPAHDCTVRNSIYYARQTGHLTIRTNAIVRHVNLDPNTGRAKGVLFVDAETMKTEEVEGRVVVLAASSLESTRIMLNSKSESWPDGLANSSGALGRYLSDHLFGVGAVGFKPVGGQKVAFPPLLIPNFRNRPGDKRSDGFIRGYQTAGYFGALRAGPFRRWMSTLILSAHGEIPPRRDNRIVIDDELNDKWGIPVPRIIFRRTENDEAMQQDMIDSLSEILEKAGYEVVMRSPEPLPAGASIHEGGTVRMGADPKTSVLNQYCQAWDVPNVFVTDGACFTTSGHQNPLLSIMAICARACDHIVDELKAGRL